MPERQQAALKATAAVESFAEVQTQRSIIGAGVSQIYYTKNTIKED